jgi:glucokinase
MIAIVNPEIVIVGGGVSLAGEKFFRPLRQTVDRLVFPPFRKNCRIVPPKLGQLVVVVGAALLAKRRGR